MNKKELEKLLVVKDDGTIDVNAIMRAVGQFNKTSKTSSAKWRIRNSRRNTFVDATGVSLSYDAMTSYVWDFVAKHPKNFCEWMRVTAPQLFGSLPDEVDPE